ncbi:hypothetical protein GGI19_005831, partial [Coemansia pectinata]
DFNPQSLVPIQHRAGSISISAMPDFDLKPSVLMVAHSNDGTPEGVSNNVVKALEKAGYYVKLSTDDVII